MEIFKDLLQMYIHKDVIKKILMNMYLTPVESYRRHLIPLASVRVIPFICKH
jgi:hypothetical protein